MKLCRYMALLPAAFICVQISCVSPHSVITADVDPAGWDASSPARVVLDNTDTISTYSIMVMARYLHPQEGGSLAFDIRTVAPDSTEVTESVSLLLQNHTGSKTMDIREAQSVYRTGVVLQRQGEYVFYMTPSGGTHIKGITAVGLEFLKEE